MHTYPKAASIEVASLTLESLSFYPSLFLSLHYYEVTGSSVILHLWPLLFRFVFDIATVFYAFSITYKLPTYLRHPCNCWLCDASSTAELLTREI